MATCIWYQQLHLLTISYNLFYDKIKLATLSITQRVLSLDGKVDGAENVETDRSPSPTGIESPVMDRNPSPPPDTADGEEDGDLDAIGDTVYSKHWLFSTLTRLINVGS